MTRGDRRRFLDRTTSIDAQVGLHHRTAVPGLYTEFAVDHPVLATGSASTGSAGGASAPSATTSSGGSNEGTSDDGTFDDGTADEGRVSVAGRALAGERTGPTGQRAGADVA